ncbi:polysaccharide biosynthesis protein [Vibrio viridaestus]|uniref:Polysaccharide biosynthesis protein n=2 Tax=Vibrio viridaestus TaxID=2487322 RepID=A0A3N9U4C4_9VIBR|nr:polysaccharide biosynthesis protein [Vibrio viridaestus]
MLYGRQILLIVVSLYTLRIVLDELGIQDYGIYSVVASIVALCTFVGGTMASATQRYFSFALGKKDTKLLKKTFSVNLVLYFLIGGVALILLEGVGTWYVSQYLNVPLERKESAVVLYHYSALTFFFTILITPLVSIFIAHEDMKLYALLSIFEALLKLLSVFVLQLIDFDKLELYGLLLLIVSVMNFLLLVVVCVYKYEECQFKKIYWDYSLAKDVLSFTGWTFFGALSNVARNQAITVMLNQFFNPTIVAARAIAVNVATQVNMFSNKFNTGLYPPIIKSYADSDFEELNKLIYVGSKLTFFLMWVFTLPLILEIKFILTLWLGDYPIQAINFTRLALIEALILAVSLPITTAARAPGRVKLYELTLGTIQYFIMVASYFSLKNGFSAESVYVVAIFANLLMFAIRLYLVKGLVGVNIKDYLIFVIKPVLVIFFGPLSIAYLLKVSLDENIINSIIIIVFSGCVSTMFMYFFGLDREWRIKIITFLKSKVNL